MIKYIRRHQERCERVRDAHSRNRGSHIKLQFRFVDKVEQKKNSKNASVPLVFVAGGDGWQMLQLPLDIH